MIKYKKKFSSMVIPKTIKTLFPPKFEMTKWLLSGVAKILRPSPKFFEIPRPSSKNWIDYTSLKNTYTENAS